MNGRVTHFEIPADDLERAQMFYRDTFGWNITPMPEMQYTLVGTTPSDEKGMPSTPGGINGGMMRRQGPMTNPVITIEVDDVDKSLEQVEKMGGKTVVGRQPVADMGFTAYFEDTEGNLMGMWQSAR